MINNFSISSNGRYVAAVMDNGNINVYSVPAISQHFSKVYNIRLHTFIVVKGSCNVKSFLNLLARRICET